MKYLKLSIPYIFILLGYFSFSFIEINTNTIIQTDIFQILIDTILVIGLYGAVYGINISDFKSSKRLIFNVITIGVVFKIVFTGLIMYLITGELISFLIATVLAQIDPVSVASLQESRNRLSRSGRTVLRAWASFDDPVTVILAVLFSMIVLGDIDNNSTILSILSIESLNLLFALCIFGLFRILPNNKYFLYVLLLLSLVVASFYELFLGIAIIGLFLRPKLSLLNDIVYVLYLVVSFTLGIMINGGVNIENGILYGFLIVISQALTTLILGRKLNKQDKYRLSFAQQSGITAITLALFLSISHNNIIPTVIVAIITINILYLILNKGLEMYCIKD